MDNISQVLFMLRDPTLIVAVVCITVTLVVFLNKNYASKEALYRVEKEIENFKNQFVSKEKLGDSIKPLKEQFEQFRNDIKAEFADLKTTINNHFLKG